MEVKFSHIVMSIISDIECDKRFRPIDIAWANPIFMALVIPLSDGETVLEFSKRESKIKVQWWTKRNTGFTRNEGDQDYNLTDPKSIDSLQEFLEGVCEDKEIIIEFPAEDDLDYLMAK